MEEVAVGYEQCSCITLVGSINKHKNHGRHQKGKLPINEAYCYEQNYIIPILRIINLAFLSI